MPPRVSHSWVSALPGVFVAAALCLSGVARAEIEASLDLRLVSSDGRDSFLDGGLGKLRYDDADDGMQLGRARLAGRWAMGGNWHANIDLSAWSLHDHNAVDVTEGWLEWRPVPQSAWKSNLKIGAFYPPISLEHRAPGWTNPYTISSSALNTWVGEELRTIGLAYELEHLGSADGGRLDYGMQAAVFGWNDPAGVILALRGWSLNDRQTPLFGRIGSYTFSGPRQRVIFSEIDHRPGYDVSGYLRWDNSLEARALHYDNRGDPEVYKTSIQDYAWQTRFNSLGIRHDGTRGTTLIAQWLDGSTIADDDPAMRWTFNAKFLLLAQSFGRQRVSARYDDFKVRQTSGAIPARFSLEHGNAWTLGWSWAVREHVELAAEWLRIDSFYNKRRALSEAPTAIEHSLQLALRLSL